MQIVHYLPYSKPFPVQGYGGGERIAYWLGKAQAQLGHQVIYLCKKVSTVPISFAKVIQVSENFDDLNPYIPPGTDIVQLYGTPNFKLDYPFLVRIGGNGAEGETYLQNTIFLSASHAANHNWTEYVHNGLDLDEYPLQKEKEDYLFYLAKAAWIVKNLPGAIKIANKANINLQVGGGQAPFWSKNIISHGTVDGQKKLKLLQNARALLFPIIWDEPFGIVSIEALACGTPVIATPRGSLPEIVDPSCGILANSFEELVEAVAKAKYFDPEACRNRVAEKFNHIYMAQQYLNYYSKILQNGSIRAGHPVSKGKPRKRIYYQQPIAHLLTNFIEAVYIKEYFK